MKKLLLTTAVMLVIAASIFGGYYFYVTNDLQETERQQKQESEHGQQEKEGATDTEWSRRWLTDAWRDENGNVSVDGLANAVAQRDAYLVAHNPQDGFGDKGVAQMNWVSRGPQNVGGRTRSLVIDPQDPNIMWAGAVSGGVWKGVTNSRGQVTWTAMNGGLQNFAVNCMALDYVPGSRKTLWAGTGDGRSGDGLAGGGLFKSTNGGMTWTVIQSTIDGRWQNIDSLAITHWVNPDTNQDETVMLAGVYSPTSSQRGIMRSTNGGQSWEPVYPGRTSISIVVDPNNPGNVIAEVLSPGAFANSPTNRVVYSDRAGKIGTWHTATRTSNPTTDPTSDPPFETDSAVHIIKLSYFKANSNIVYANDGDPFGSIGQMSKSMDGGHSFTTNGLGGIQYFWGYLSLFWVSPTEENVIVTGGNLLHRSNNGGTTGSFSPIGGGQDWEPYPHDDQQYAISDPRYGIGSNRRVYTTNDGGINRADDITTATRENGGWVNLNRTYQTTQFYSAAGDSSTGIISGGTQDNGSMWLVSGTQNAVHWGFGDGGFSAVDGNVCYGQTNGVLHQIKNCGTSNRSDRELTQGITDYPGNVWLAPMIVDRTNPNRFFFGGSSVWRSDNILATHSPDWTKIKANPTPVRITAADILPANPDIMWVAEMDSNTLSAGRIYRTVNATASPGSSVAWTTIDDNVPSPTATPTASPSGTPISHGDPLPNRKILKILIDPSDPSGNTVYVGFAGGFTQGNTDAEKNLWRTRDGGAHWTDITGDDTGCTPSPSSIGLPCVPVNAIAINPYDASRIYVGTDIGLYTTDTDVSVAPALQWHPVMSGPANVKISDLNFMRGTGTTLLAATYGRGLWTVDFNQSSSNPKAINDFDGDGRSDIAVVREDSSHKMWHLQGSSESYRSQEFGNRDDQAAPADYDGDGKTDIAVYRGTEQKFYCLRSSDNTLATTQLNHQASQAEAALAADFDGDDLADKAVFDPYTGNWKVEQSSNGHLDFHWGEVGDTAVALDFNTDGQADFGVYHEANGMITLSYTANGEEFQKQFGLEGDVPVPGEYDGDKAMDLAVWRPDDDGEGNGCWYISYGANNYEGYDAIPWGQSGDIPVPGDYDGDGKLDIAVFRPSDGLWHMLQSSNGYYSELFGADGDKPVGIKATYASRGAGNHTFTRAPAWAVPARRAPVRGVKQDTSADQAD